MVGYNLKFYNICFVLNVDKTINKKYQFLVMEDFIHVCPVCQSRGITNLLQLRQIHLSTAVYLCRDPKCSYPSGYSWIFTDRRLSDVEDDSDSDLSDIVNEDIEKAKILFTNSDHFKQRNHEKIQDLEPVLHSSKHETRSNDLLRDIGKLCKENIDSIDTVTKFDINSSDTQPLTSTISLEERTCSDNVSFANIIKEAERKIINDPDDSSKYFDISTNICPTEKVDLLAANSANSQVVDGKIPKIVILEDVLLNKNYSSVLKDGTKNELNTENSKVTNKHLTGKNTKFETKEKLDNVFKTRLRLRNKQEIQSKSHFSESVVEEVKRLMENSSSQVFLKKKRFVDKILGSKRPKNVNSASSFAGFTFNQQTVDRESSNMISGLGKNEKLKLSREVTNRIKAENKSSLSFDSDSSKNISNFMIVEKQNTIIKENSSIVYKSKSADSGATNQSENKIRLNRNKSVNPQLNTLGQNNFEVDDKICVESIVNNEMNSCNDMEFNSFFDNIDTLTMPDNFADTAGIDEWLINLCQ